MEYRDIYDINRYPTGRKILRGAELQADEYYIVVHGCIINSEKKMLIQQRSENKKAFPNAWDVSFGGSVISGETSQQAVAREMLEELGIKYDFSMRRPNMTMNFDHGFDDFYLIELDVSLEEISVQSSEVKDVRWAGCDEIIEMISDGSFIPFQPNFIKLIFDTYNRSDCLDI